MRKTKQDKHCLENFDFWSKSMQKSKSTVGQSQQLKDFNGQSSGQQNLGYSSQVACLSCREVDVTNDVAMT